MNGRVRRPFRSDSTIDSDRLYGRGSCDMKGSIACFLTATERYATTRRPLYVVLTSDEETGQYGAAHVVAESRLYRELRERQCASLVGEPTQLNIVHAHKGTCLFRAVARGRAAHSGGRTGKNANLAMIPFLGELLATVSRCRIRSAMARRTIRSADPQCQHRRQRWKRGG